MSRPATVGDWSVAWNAKAEATRLGPGIPKSDFCASAKEGIDQVGWGWIGQPEQSHPRLHLHHGVSQDDFTRCVKRTYRVLLTRGLRGCYVYFMDSPTRDFVLSRIEQSAPARLRAAEQSADYSTKGPTT